MPVNVKGLEDQIVALATKCQAVVDDNDRPWDGDAGRAKELDAMEKDIAVLTAKHKAWSTSDETLKKFQGIADQNEDLNQRMNQLAVKTLGEQLTDSPDYAEYCKQVKMGVHGASGGIELKAGGILGETNFTGTDGIPLTSTSGGSGLLVPQYLTTPVQKLFQRLTVADLLPTGTLTGASLIYPVESTVANGAQSVAEGGLKPNSDLGLTMVTELLKKIATRLKISDEMLQDVPAVQSYVNARLVLFVQIQEEAQLLAGNGSGSNLTGLLNRSNMATAIAMGAGSTPVAKLEALYTQMTAIRTGAFVEPDAMILNPLDYQLLRFAKDGQGQYYAGGPFTGAYGNGSPGQDSNVLSSTGFDVWNKRVVVTTAIPQGTALVGSFQTCAQVFRRGGLTVEMTNSNEDDFNHDLVSIRAEERVMLAVYRPGGFGKVTGLNL